MKPNKSSFYAYLKDKREQKGLSQFEVAQKLGYTSPQFISNWERGLCNPPVVLLMKLAKIYEIDPNELYEKLREHVEISLKQEFFGAKKPRTP